MNSELCVYCEVVNISLSHLAFTHALTVPGLFLTHFWTYTFSMSSAGCDMAWATGRAYAGGFLGCAVWLRRNSFAVGASST
jgi:hypothetical protein